MHVCMQCLCVCVCNACVCVCMRGCICACVRMRECMHLYVLTYCVYVFYVCRREVAKRDAISCMCACNACTDFLCDVTDVAYAM